MKPLGYFNQFPQGEAFVTEFGDYDVHGLPKIDQAALLSLLSLFLYHQIALRDPGLFNSINASSSLQEIAGIHFPPPFDFTSDNIQQAIAILEGIDFNQALGVIAFLSQDSH